MTTAASSTLPPDVSRPTSKRIYNFSAGPATLPEEVLLAAREAMWDIFDTGIGIMEHSHRGKAFDRVLDEAIADCRALGSISDDYEILFLQGGATLQFAMIPMAWLGRDQTADYLNTGEWSSKAIKEAGRFGDVNVAFDGEKTTFDHIPDDNEIARSTDAVYLHYTSNNTIYGTQYPQAPRSVAPLISDASSDMFSRPIDINAHAMIYAGAQKNLGPSGVVLVIIRRDWLERANTEVPTMLNYCKIAEKKSCLNTPPTFGIYFMGQVFKWILAQGGLDAMAERNQRKAQLIYDAIDDSSGFYRCFAQPGSRSLMNITFRTGSPELDASFIAEAARHDMANIKGYRTMGGMRASIYNAFPRDGCEALAQFMRDFADRNG